MRLPRMTTRRWMVAVAVVALLMGGVVVGYRLKRRYDYFLLRVQQHDSLEISARITGQYLIEDMDELSSMPASSPIVTELEYAMSLGLRIQSYHEAMARKYRHAARYPWLPVEPDPPEPE